MVDDSLHALYMCTLSGSSECQASMHDSLTELLQSDTIRNRCLKREKFSSTPAKSAHPPGLADSGLGPTRSESWILNTAPNFNALRKVSEST